MRPVRALALAHARRVSPGSPPLRRRVKRVLPSRGDAESDEVALVAIFDGVQLEEPRGRPSGVARMLAWFGGIAVDLREATLAAGRPPLRPRPLRRGRDPGAAGLACRVEHAGRSQGGVDVSAPEPEDEAAPTLTLDGLALFGGIAVGAGVAEAAFSDEPEPV